MKKQIYFFLALVLIGLASCTYPTYQTIEGETCKFNKKTIDLICNQNEWSYNANANAYYCHFTVDMLTAEAYKYGEVSVNREYYSGTNKAYQVALPETTYMVEQDGENTFYYAQHVDYVYGVGYIEIYYTVSDYFYPEGFTPEGMVFRAQLTY